MSSFVATSCTVLWGTAWTGTAPGAANPTISGTITSSTNFTDHLRSVTLNNTTAMQDLTTFADGAFVVQKPGLMTADITLEFNQDFAASNIDAVFGAAQIAQTLGYLDLTPTSAARGTTNPSYVYAVYVNAYPPMGQAVGDAAVTQVGFSVFGKYARLTA
jgi:hypothetical protein